MIIIFICKVDLCNNINCLDLKADASKAVNRALEFVNNKNVFKNIEEKTYIDFYLNTRSSSFQSVYRKALIEEFGCKCAICGINKKELLVASHIVAYTDCKNNEERIDNNNGLLLCSLHDDLFDNGYISFDNNGKIILPKKSDISPQLYPLLNITSEIVLDEKYLTIKGKAYLKRHKKR